MGNKLDCEIVRDLLPSYVDGLTSEETNEAVKEHLEGCEDCSQALRRMKEPEEPAKNTAAPEVDYLKKVRRRTKRVGLTVGIVMMLVGMLLIGARVFFIGNTASPEDVNFNISVEDNAVTVSGSLQSSTVGVARAAFSDSAGIVEVKLYTAPRFFLNSGEFEETYESHGPVGMVRCGDLILWEGDTEINTTAARLYAAVNPYVGDMPANGEVASILGIPDQFGSYTNELQTTTEPYGWTLILETRIAGDEERAAQNIMFADSCAMLAAVGNLGYVTWEYNTEAGAQEYTVTADNASAFTGQDIKQFADSPSHLQTLLQGLSIKWSGVRELFSEDGALVLAIRNDTDSELYGVGINYYLDGESIGSRGFENADHSPLAKGSQADFHLTPDDFPVGTSAIQLAGLSFDLTVTGADGKETIVCKDIKVPGKYSWRFPYTLSGNDKSGYQLNEN